MSEKIKLSIAIPVYNSESTIENLVTQLIEKLSKEYELEIVLINDCSKDNSEKICIGLYERNKDIVKFYSLAKNVGEHNAVMAALNKVTGSYVVVMDDDFQNPVSEVIKLVSYASANSFDVVYTYYDKKFHSFFRNLGSKFNDKLANYMLGKPKNLYLSSFKVMNKFIVDEVIKYDRPYPYLDGLILRTTSNIGKLKVEHRGREKGDSNYTFKKLISLWLNMFTNFSILPLRISIILGFVFAIWGLVLGTYTFFEKLADPGLPIGFAAIAVSIFVFAGIQLIALGMIGEYVGRIFISQTRKSQFTIRKSFEKKI